MIRPRPEITNTPPAPHGGPQGSAGPRSPVRTDFSVSMNAFGPAPIVLEAIRAARPDVYPDPDLHRPAPRRLAPLGAPAGGDRVRGRGGELLHALCFAFVRPGETAPIPNPTFGEYARAVGLCGGRVLQGIAPPPAYALDTEEIAAAVVQHRPRMVFLCAPNNPTGQPFPREELRRVADVSAAAGTLMVLDQSYDAFLREPLGTPALPGHPAVLHLRSLTREHALAGVRAGFAVGPESIIRALERGRPPWPVSTVAQAAAVAAFTDAGLAHVAESVPRLRFERELLEAAFARLRLPTVRTGTHYLLAAVGDAAALTERLREEHAIRVRDCASFGLPGHVRVAARTPAENNLLVAALEAACSG